MCHLADSAHCFPRNPERCKKNKSVLRSGHLFKRAPDKLLCAPSGGKSVSDTIQCVPLSSVYALYVKDSIADYSSELSIVDSIGEQSAEDASPAVVQRG